MILLMILVSFLLLLQIVTYNDGDDDF